MAVTIDEGTTFPISDGLGDVHEHGAFGLFSEDTRFLCPYRLLLDGHAPVSLAAEMYDDRAAEHFLTNPELKHVPASALAHLAAGTPPDVSPFGIALAALSVVVSSLIAWLKLRKRVPWLVVGRSGRGHAHGPRSRLPGVAHDPPRRRGIGVNQPATCPRTAGNERAAKALESCSRHSFHGTANPGAAPSADRR